MFRDDVQNAIRQLEEWVDLPPEETDWLQVGEDCRWLLADLEQKALASGLPDAVAACQVSGAITSHLKARQVLAKCLAVSQSEYEPEPIEPVLLTVKQASERYNISGRILYRLLQEGDLQNYGPGNSKRIKPADLESYLEQQSRPASTASSLFD